MASTINLHSTFFELIKFSTLLILLVSIQAILVPKEWTLIFPSILLFSIFIYYSYSSKTPPIYLVDFSCLSPPSSCRVPFSFFLENASKLNVFTPETISFMSKILHTSGISQETYLPPALHYIPPKNHQQDFNLEAEMALFPIMDNLLSKTNLSPKDIDILIVNCSGFCPSPSLASIVVNRFGMRDDIKSFNLSGMGCSASALGVDLAQNLLKIHKNSYAIVLSTEILSAGWYPGNEQPKLLLNCLFRMGSAAILLSNKKSAVSRSKYKLLCSVRTQRAFDDTAHFSSLREEDSKGILGFTLKRGLLQVAEETLRSHIITLAMRIFPFTEKLMHGVSILRKKYLNKSSEIYVPDFRKVIDHFCLPVAGKKLIREISKGLKLKERDTEAALMAFHRFGNQSSSSLWYQLDYLEGKDRVKKGDKVWVLGMGSGVKSCSLIWESINVFGDRTNILSGPWKDCLDRYPIVLD